MSLTRSCVERWNWASKFTIFSETLKKSIASQAQANHLRKKIKIEIKIQPLEDTTYPERKRPHCVQVRLLRTSHNGLVRSTFSFFGRRFRRKYGAIEAIYIEGSSTRGETEGGRVDPEL